MSGRMVSQGSDSICWAASDATTLRYLTNSYSYTARGVCDKIGHSYSTGTLNDMQKALSAYGITYSNLVKSQIPFSSLSNNICNEYPVMAALYSEKYGHAVTILGYKNYGGIQMIVYYNSGNNKIETAIYSSTGTKCSYVNTIFVWKETLSKY